jgi:N-acetyl-gamma-glutamyl-phosphate reductase
MAQAWHTPADIACCGHVSWRVMTEQRSDTGMPALGGRATIRVGIIGAAGYVGGELIRLLERHPNVRVAGLQGRDRDHEPATLAHPQLAGSGHHIEGTLPEVDAVFLALPHGASASLVPELVEQGRMVIDLGADYRLRDPADYVRWYGFEHPAPELLARAVYGLPEQHRAELQGLQGAGTVIIGAPGCYPTTSLLGLYPLTRAGLIGDVVVDAKSGASGAGRAPKAELQFSEVNESVKAYGLSGHRHLSELIQELGAACATPGANPGAATVDFIPHLVPMQRGILAACHVRPTRPVSAAELQALYEQAYADEPFVRVVGQPPATSHVRGSNLAHVHPYLVERTGRIVVISVIDNLVKGAAGQALQAFNLACGLPETAGLEQLPLVP